MSQTTPALAAPHSLYAAHSAPDNANNRLLLSSLPFDVLANAACGFASRVLRWGKQQVAALSAWLSYIEKHSNRVWPGEETIAQDASCHPRTVRRMKAALRDALGLAPVPDSELWSGPGPHQYGGVKRSVREVDTFDLSPLVALLPPALVELLAAPQDIQPVASSRVLVDETGFPDPFAEQVAGFFVSASAENPTASEVPHSHAQSAIIAPCNVGIGRNAQEESEARPVPARKFEKASGAATAENVLRPKMSPIVEGGEGPGFAALRGIGMWSPICAEIIAQRGDAWAYKLARYSCWARGVEPSKRAAFARATWANWEGWPGWFADKFAKEEAAQERAAVLEANARAAVPVRAPAAPVQTVETPPALLERALAQERARRPLGERAKLTIDSPPVRVRARLLMLQEKNNLPDV